MFIKSREQSDYFKDKNPYIHTWADYGRKADLIFIIVLKTPTGRWAKRFDHYRFSGVYKYPEAVEVRKALQGLLKRLDYSNGKTAYEIIQYSGEADYSGLKV